MSVTFVETYESRKFHIAFDGNSTVTIHFKTYGSESEDEVRTKVEERLPFVWAGNSDYTFQSYDLAHMGGGIYEGTANYGLRVEPVIHYSTVGGTQRITQSITTVASVKRGGGTAPNFKNAIGVNNDTVEGVDVVVPAITFTEIYRIPKELVTQEYRKILARLTGKMNDAPFRDWAENEVVFRGADYSMRGGERVELNFQFAVSLSEEAVEISGLPSIDKAGWDYLWIRYSDTVNEKALTKRPESAYVEQVYPFADFTELGIGTGPW